MTINISECLRFLRRDVKKWNAFIAKAKSQEIKAWREDCRKHTRVTALALLDAGDSVRGVIRMAHRMMHLIRVETEKLVD